jgi:PA14 domain
MSTVTPIDPRTSARPQAHDFVDAGAPGDPLAFLLAVKNVHVGPDDRGSAMAFHRFWSGGYSNSASGRATMAGTDTTDRTLPIALFIFFFVTFAYFFQSGSDNENARFDQARAIVERGQLHINEFAGNTADVVVKDSRVYPNKAPGGSLLIVPHYLIFSRLLSLLPLSRPVAQHLTAYLMTLFSVGLAAALLNVVLFLVLEKILARRVDALFLTLAYGLGSIAFPFSTLLFSHQLTAALIFLSFAIQFFLEESKRRRALPRTRRVYGSVFLSGCLLGYSLTCEYPAAIALPPVALYALYVLRSDRRLLGCFIVGGILGCSPILIYNQLAFGAPFFITYSLYATGEQTIFPEHGQGFMGVSVPRPDVLRYITVGSQRGLFVCNPWLALLIPAVAVPFVFKSHRPVMAVSLSIVLGFLVFNAAFAPGIVYAGGGASVGPRHVLPMLPFATLLVAPLLWTSLFRRAFYILALLSASIMLMATATEPRVPYEYNNPVRDLFWSNYRDGRFALQRHGIFNDTLMTGDSVSFNLGKLFSLPGEWQLVPLLLFWLLGFLVLLLLLRRAGNIARIRGPLCSALILITLLIAIPIAQASVERSRETGSHGLQATLIEGIAWSDCSPTYAPVHFPGERVIRKKKDPRVLFNWDEQGPPFPGPFSIQWEGYLRAPANGEFVIATNSDDGSCVYVDGHRVVDNWGMHSARIREGRVRLQAGFHQLTVLYYNAQFGGLMELLWARDGHHLMPIPSEALFEVETHESTAPAQIR